MRTSRTFFSRALVILVLVTMVLSMTTAFAAAELENKYYIGAAVKTGTDNGYAGAETISSNDPHWGWKIGEFFISGYTRQTTDENGNPVFLKTVGDTITLWFDLQQDIAKLNGNDKLSICEDTNGYDEYFGVPKTNFGKGTLIIRHTDYQNHAAEPVVYTDYLSANLADEAAVEVQFFEEGDYEVALNYEIIEHKLDIFGWDPIPQYHSYRIFFRFSVRNGNCMVYPFDVTTGEELTDSSLTENGFYLDLAKSRYLDIDIKKTVRAEGAEGLVEDTRFNKPAKDGEQFTDEGIYTITVHNHYTNQTTTKVIYVGTDDVLKAHVVTGMSLSDIEYQLSMGATVAADGTLIPPPEEDPPAIVGPDTNSAQPGAQQQQEDGKPRAWPFVLIAALLIAVAAGVTVAKKKATPTAPGAQHAAAEEKKPEDEGGAAE